MASARSSIRSASRGRVAKAHVMSRVIHIIASCTDRKHEKVPGDLHLRSIGGGADVGLRAARWWARLTEHRHPTVVAQELYAGDHWRVVKELPQVARAAGLKPHLWVASAGYGLIEATTAVRPYSATFARGQADSVVQAAVERNTSALLQLWWTTIARRKGPNTLAPRSVAELAASSPSATILVVASSLYVAAMEQDLVAAATALRSREQLLVVSTASPRSKGALALHWVPSTAHLQSLLGGSRLSLHARVARNVLEEAPHAGITASEVRARLERLIRRSDAPVQYDRKPMTDEEVKRFVRSPNTRAVAKSWSAALRLLRSQGLACEQRRFKQLYISLQERT